ncbi:MAG: F0F1 ATP synthase subunit epsilon [Nitrospira sp.]|nr:F0F1 ATP synthase subunit epsilon [Nitrospira sp.]
MKPFTLLIQDATHVERFDDVGHLIGWDDSGAFGLLAGHERFMTILSWGLARFQTMDEHWQFLALPGGLLYVRQNLVTISTRRFFRDDDVDRISRRLEDELSVEEEGLRAIKESLSRLEEEMFKRFWQMGRGEWAS